MVESSLVIIVWHHMTSTVHTSLRSHPQTTACRKFVFCQKQPLVHAVMQSKSRSQREWDGTSSANIVACLYKVHGLLGLCGHTHSLMMRVAAQPASSSVLAYAQRLQDCHVLTLGQCCVTNYLAVIVFRVSV